MCLICSETAKGITAGYVNIMKIKITIDRFEEDKAVLKTEAGDTIVWPKNQLPDNAREGEVFSFEFYFPCFQLGII